MAFSTVQEDNKTFTTVLLGNMAFRKIQMQVESIQAWGLESEWV